MSSCTVFVFLSLIEYAFVNVMMGDISEVERKDKTSHLRNVIIASNTNLGYSWQQQKHPSQTQFQGIKVNILQYTEPERARAPALVGFLQCLLSYYKKREKMGWCTVEKAFWILCVFSSILKYLGHDLTLNSTSEW